MIEFDFEGHAKSQIDKGLGYLEGFSKGYHQAKSEWVGLTKQEYDDIYENNKYNLYDAMMAVVAYLKRKNT